MANYYATARSNYFKVKDIAAFQKTINRQIPGVGVHVFNDKTNAVMIDASEFTDNGAWPTSRWIDDSDDGDDTIGHDEEINYAAVIAPHLLEGETAVLMEVGNEKLRYVTGFARAIHSNGEEVIVNIDDIYAKAAKTFGVDSDTISRCEY